VRFGNRVQANRRRVGSEPENSEYLPRSHLPEAETEEQRRHHSLRDRASLGSGVPYGTATAASEKDYTPSSRTLTGSVGVFHAVTPRIASRINAPRPELDAPFLRSQWSA